MIHLMVAEDAQAAMLGFTWATRNKLGNGEDAQHRLYALNSSTALETLGAGGEPSWLSFEDFQQSVCRADWYRLDGHDWVAMSAITRFTNADYAYNLFTGVDRRYRGRKLARRSRCWRCATRAIGSASPPCWLSSQSPYEPKCLIFGRRIGLG